MEKLIASADSYWWPAREGGKLYISKPWHWNAWEDNHNFWIQNPLDIQEKGVFEPLAQFPKDN